jgi:hypothetical protein
MLMALVSFARSGQIAWNVSRVHQPQLTPGRQNVEVVREGRRRDAQVPPKFIADVPSNVGLRANKPR